MTQGVSSPLKKLVEGKKSKTGCKTQRCKIILAVL